jgi:hypothetical protein
MQLGASVPPQAVQSQTNLLCAGDCRASHAAVHLPTTGFLLMVTLTHGASTAQFMYNKSKKHPRQ